MEGRSPLLPAAVWSASLIFCPQSTFLSCTWAPGFCERALNPHQPSPHPCRRLVCSPPNSSLWVWTGSACHVGTPALHIRTCVGIGGHRLVSRPLEWRVPLCPGPGPPGPLPGPPQGPPRAPAALGPWMGLLHFAGHHGDGHKGREVPAPSVPQGLANISEQTEAVHLCVHNVTAPWPGPCRGTRVQVPVQTV